MSDDGIINKVANSGLVTIDLEEFYPVGQRVVFDLKPWLFHELILKEKDFRDFIKFHDWSQYQDKFVAVMCSADAIIPTWAFILVGLALEPYAKKTVFGNLQNLESVLFSESLHQISAKDYIDKRVVIKGCSNLPVPINAYIELTQKLKPVVKSIMYGEPCSTVPLYKAPILK